VLLTMGTRLPTCVRAGVKAALEEGPGSSARFSIVLLSGTWRLELVKTRDRDKTKNYGRRRTRSYQKKRAGNRASGSEPSAKCCGWERENEAAVGSRRNGRKWEVRGKEEMKDRCGEKMDLWGRKISEARQRAKRVLQFNKEKARFGAGKKNREFHAMCEVKNGKR